MKSTILEIGVSPSQPKFIQDKVRLSNQVAIIFAVVGISYTIFSMIFYPTLVIYPIGCTILSLTTFMINQLRLIHLSRFILSSLVLVLAYLYHANLINQGEPFITSLLIIEFVLTIIPWVLFDFRETVLLVSSLIICYGLLLSQNWAIGFFDTDLNSEVFREGFLNYASYAFAVMILISCLLFLQVKNLNAEREIVSLIEDVRVKNDELEQQKNQLHKTVEEVNTARAEESKRNWINEGLAKMDNFIRVNDDEDVYSKLITFIVKHANLNQGGIYLAEGNEEEMFLTLKGCYAYEREKFIDQKFNLEEGLMGQAFKEGEPILLSEVPKDYIKITSGLGEATPNCIFIVPLRNDSKVSGIMELASFNEIEQHVQQFILNAAEHIGSFLESFKSNIKTRELLEQTQLQAEEMKAQEEEMKQNMEELQAIHEEMNRKEREYIEKISSLEQKLGMESSGGSAEFKTYQ